MDHQIGKRLKEFRERTNIKMPEIANQTGILKETLYKWEKGTKPRDLNDYFRLKAYLDKMEDNPGEDLFAYEDQKPATMRLPLNPNRMPVPQTDGKAAAGTITLIENEPELIVDRISAPFIGFADGVVEMRGDSMEPTFKSGCRAAITRIKNKKLIEAGECYYLVDSNWRGYIKRTYLAEDGKGLRLVSDNPDKAKYPAMVRLWHEIEALFRIIAWIQTC